MAPTRFVRRLWRAPSSTMPNMISVANPCWGLVFELKSSGAKSVFLHGPETAATTVPIPQNAEYFGIEFDLGSFVPTLQMAKLTDTSIPLQVLSDGTFVLFGETVEMPTFDNADLFVNRLVHAGLLVGDATVEQALLRQPVALTDRSIQRRFMAATGMTYGTIRQLDRAERAADLLCRGTPILDVVDKEGFSDQAHLTRSVKKFLGKTPGEILPTAR
jgi:AraC-like DNA-binding protein